MLGEQTDSGLQVLVALAQSMPQLIFTCYIRANLGPGYGGWKEDVITEVTGGFDERIFAIITSTCTLCIGRATISATNVGKDDWNFKKLSGTDAFPAIH